MTILFALACYVAFFAPAALVTIMALAMLVCSVTWHSVAGDPPDRADDPPVPPAWVVER